MTTTSGQGIMEMIQRKKDAYQNNRGALEKEYQQDGQLLDLIALQLMEEERKAKARAAQLAMQTNPQTIAQQKEQQMLATIKQEQGSGLGQVRDRVRQVGGVLGQRQREAQQRQKRMGIATAAQGGIVGYTAGGDVTDEEIDEYLKENPLESELPRRVIAGKIAKQRRAAGTGPILRNIKAGALGTEPPKPEEYSGMGRGTTTRNDAAIARVVGNTPAAQAQKLKEEAEQRRKQTTTAQQGATSGTPTTATTGATPPSDPKDFDFSIPTMGAIDVGTQRQDIFDNIKTKTGLGTAQGEADRERRRAEATARTLGLLGRDDKLAVKDRQLQKLQDLTARQAKEDPFEAFISGTIGAARRGGPGGFAEGYIGQRSIQKAREVKRLADERGIEDAKIDLDFKIAQEGIQSGQDAYNALAEDQRAQASSLTSLAADDVKLALEKARQEFQTNVENKKTKLELFKQKLEDRRAAAGRAADQENALRELILEFFQNDRELFEELYKESGVLGAVDERGVNLAIDRFSNANVQFSELKELSGVNDIMEAIMKDLEIVLSGSGGLLDPDPDLAEAIKRNQ
mgnify:FL=1|tara:strand:+ start:5509 stop:7224 length:1716 start_codon:yes stop_codon:yes gene_type:complete